MNYLYDYIFESDNLVFCKARGSCLARSIGVGTDLKGLLFVPEYASLVYPFSKYFPAPPLEILALALLFKVIDIASKVFSTAMLNYALLRSY